MGYGFPNFAKIVAIFLEAYAMLEFVFPLKVYIEDTDYGGVVYHSNYLKFFERARSEWLETIGIDPDWQKEQDCYFVIRAVTIDFLKPAKLNDRVEVLSEIKEVTRTSIIFSQQLRKAQTTDTILCKAEVRVVCVDQTIRPKALPGQIHEIFPGEQA
jgi:acyl-CoA thioester hydrolase